MHPIFKVSSTDLKNDVRQAAVLNLTARGIDLVFQFLGLTVLARLIAPDDYGVFAMVTPFIAVIMIFGDLGLASAVLQQRDLTEPQAAAVLLINALAGLVLGAVLLAAAPLLGIFYHDPRVTPVAAALSPIFLISGLTAVQRGLFRRALRFGALLRAGIFADLVSFTVGIVLALEGAGYWALTARALVDPLAFGIAMWLSSRWMPPRPAWDATTKSMIRYGMFFLGFSLLNTVGRQSDNVLIGWRYGSGELGPYALAYRFFFLPVQQVTGPLGQVMIPAFSRLRDDPDRLKSWYLKVLRLMTFFAFPPVFSLVICADDVVNLLAGSRWERAAVILRWLAPIGALHVAYTTIGWLMQSQGRADRNFFWSAIAITAYVASFILGLPWGAVGVAAAYAGANLLLFVPGFIYATKGTLIRVSNTFDAMMPCFIVTMFTVPAVYVVRVAIASDWGVIARLAFTAGVIAAIMIVGALVTYGPATIFDSVMYFRNLLFRRRECG